MSGITTEVIADSDKRKKKKDLGIFYTPVEVVDFIFSLLKIHKEKQNERWKSNGRQRFPSVIDPAAGEGIFLKRAVQSGFTNGTHIFGLDIDKEAVEKWKTIHLLTEVFNGDEAALKRHFFHQNGLVPVKWEQHKEFYKGLKKADIENEQFDAVVGNPPYGGIGVDFTGSKMSPEEMELLDSLQNFELLRYKKYPPSERNKPGVQGSLFGEPKAEYNARLPLTEVARIAQSIPIEALFTERFIQLAKPGGWVAMIIPDGILSNSNQHYLRQFIADKCYVRAIVSLPRETFKHVKTNAKTSVLVLEKKVKEDDNLNYRVFLSAVAKFGITAFDIGIKQYQSFIQTGELCSIKSAKKQ